MKNSEENVEANAISSVNSFKTSFNATGVTKTVVFQLNSLLTRLLK